VGSLAQSVLYLHDTFTRVGFFLGDTHRGAYPYKRVSPRKWCRARIRGERVSEMKKPGAGAGLQSEYGLYLGKHSMSGKTGNAIPKTRSPGLPTSEN